MRFLLFTLLLSGSAFSQSIDEVIAPLDLNQPVIDSGSILQEATELRLSNFLQQLRREKGTQIAVVTLSSIADNPIESVSLAIVEKWQLGSAKEDNGALLLIAVKERRVRIEIGQGLEGQLTDSYSRRIIDQIITPQFRAGKVDLGTMLAVERMVSYIHPDFKANDNNRIGTNTRKASTVEVVILLLVIFFFIFTRPGRYALIALLTGSYAAGRTTSGYRNSGYGRGRSGFGGFGGSGGGGFGGGGFGGGGGGFSGGGSSGSW